MLWSGYDDFISIAIADGEHPCPSTLTDDGSGLPVKPAVRHPFLDAWFDDHVHPVTDLKMLNYGGNRRQSAFS
jgi:hypothetical protein